MFKIHVLLSCENCNGEAYLSLGEAESYSGEIYIRYQLCPACQGSGKQAKWVSLEEFAVLLRQARCKHEHTSFQGSMRFVAGDVDDDITEVCIDCGAKLDGQVLGDIIDMP